MAAGVTAATERKLLELSATLWTDICSQPMPTTTAELWKEHLMIRAILEEMRQTCPPAPMFGKRESRQQQLDAFFKWADKADIEARRVNVAPSALGDGSLGLIATGDIERGDALVKVPRRAILSWDVARKEPMLKEAVEKDSILRRMDNVALALCVLCEKMRGGGQQKRSFWAPYLNTLPDTYATPLFFSEEEMQLLRPSPAFDDALRMFRAIARQFAHFHLMLAPPRPARQPSAFSLPADKPPADPRDETPPLLRATPLTPLNFSFDAYKWAVSTVSTRINLIPSADANNADGSPVTIPALIPFLDMANHGGVGSGEGDKMSVHFCAKTNKAGCTATDDYSYGQEVTIYYGLRTNADHLLHNGFVPSANENNTYKVKLGISKTDPIYELRVDALKKLGLEPQASFELSGKREPIPEPMHRFARVFVADLSDRQLQAPDNAENHFKAWKFLADRFKLLLAGYESAKKKQPKAEELTANSKVVLRLLAQEEAIVRGALRFAVAKVEEFAEVGHDAPIRDLNLDSADAPKPFNDFDALD